MKRELDAEKEFVSLIKNEVDRIEAWVKTVNSSQAQSNHKVHSRDGFYFPSVVNPSTATIFASLQIVDAQVPRVYAQHHSSQGTTIAGKNSVSRFFSHAKVRKLSTNRPNHAVEFRNQNSLISFSSPTKSMNFAKVLNSGCHYALLLPI